MRSGVKDLGGGGGAGREGGNGGERPQGLAWGEIKSYRDFIKGFPGQKGRGMKANLQSVLIGAVLSLGRAEQLFQV